MIAPSCREKRPSCRIERMRLMSNPVSMLEPILQPCIMYLLVFLMCFFVSAATVLALKLVFWLVGWLTDDQPVGERCFNAGFGIMQRR